MGNNNIINLIVHRSQIVVSKIALHSKLPEGFIVLQKKPYTIFQILHILINKQDPALIITQTKPTTFISELIITNSNTQKAIDLAYLIYNSKLKFITPSLLTTNFPNNIEQYKYIILDGYSPKLLQKIESYAKNIIVFVE